MRKTVVLHVDTKHPPTYEARGALEQRIRVLEQRVAELAAKVATGGHDASQ